MVPDTDRVYGTAPLADPHLAVWNEQVKPGVKCAVELYPDRFVEERIRRFTVRRVRPGVYRAVILVGAAGDTLPSCFGVESSRDDAALWLRRQGVPVLRIGPALPK